LRFFDGITITIQISGMQYITSS